MFAHAHIWNDVLNSDKLQWKKQNNLLSTLPPHIHALFPSSKSTEVKNNRKRDFVIEMKNESDIMNAHRLTQTPSERKWWNSVGRKREKEKSPYVCIGMPYVDVDESKMQLEICVMQEKYV